LFCLLALILPACSPGATRAPAATLTVMAASSLTAAFTELGAQFEARHPDARVIFTFAGSQQLGQQIAQGAAADVFASANHEEMANAVETNRIQAGSVWLFATNRLVVIYPTDNPANIRGLGDLASGGLKLILAAQEVPAGKYSLAFLDKLQAAGDFGADYRAAVLANVVSYEDNVRAVLTKVALGEADAGIVYTSDVNALDAPRVGQLVIPDERNVLAQYPIAALADSPHPELAAQFIAFVVSPEGQAVLAKHGFLPAGQE
jgi:molybdate transport system substrate-binding protein